MMRTRRLALSLVAGGVLVAFAAASWRASAQDDHRQGLIGTWDGVVTQGQSSTASRLRFSERDGAIVWVWSWRAPFGRDEAGGSMAPASAPSIELRGRYTVHPAKRIVGSPVSLSLRVRGTSMEGTGLTAMVNQPFTLSLSKVSHARRPLDRVAARSTSSLSTARPPFIH